MPLASFSTRLTPRLEESLSCVRRFVGEIVLPPPLIAGTLDDLSTRGSF
jgi:hypothetical protein